MIEYMHDIPSRESFFALYATTSWNSSRILSDEQIWNGINHSWYTASAYDGDRLVGFGRLVSDGGYQVFVTDVIVSPDYQRKGIGFCIMNELLDFCKKNQVFKAQLFCAEGKKDFYKKLGFQARPESAPGMQVHIAQRS